MRPFKDGLISKIFHFGSNLLKKGAKPLTEHFSLQVDSAQGSDMAPIFGDLSQIHFIRLSQVVLEFDS